MQLGDYRSFDALCLAELVAQGQVTAHELLDTALEAIADRNPSLNAVVNLFDDQARAAIDDGLGQRLQLRKRLVPVLGTRTLRKSDMVLNDYLPVMEVDPQTYEVRADGQLLTCEPATVLPLAQRYFLF